MTKWYKAAVFLVMILGVTVSCRQLYTSSVGAVFARDSINIPKSTSIDDLLDMANSSLSDSPKAAKEILDVLGGKPDAAIQALSVSEQETILNLASTAAIDVGTINDIFAGYDSATSDTNALITQALGAFDSSVDMGAVLAIITDTDAQQNASVDSLIWASAVVLADISAAPGSSASLVMDVLAGTSPITALPADQQTQMTAIIALRGAIDLRAPTDTTIAGFNLTDLLKGNQ